MKATVILSVLLCFIVSSAHCQTKPPAYECMHRLLNTCRISSDVFRSRALGLLLSTVSHNIAVAIRPCLPIFAKPTSAPGVQEAVESSRIVGRPRKKLELRKLNSPACVSTMKDAFEKKYEHSRKIMANERKLIQKERILRDTQKD